MLSEHNAIQRVESPMSNKNILANFACYVSAEIVIYLLNGERNKTFPNEISLNIMS